MEDQYFRHRKWEAEVQFDVLKSSISWNENGELNEHVFIQV
jgi:hypothetical protein